VIVKVTASVPPLAAMEDSVDVEKVHPAASPASVIVGVKAAFALFVIVIGIVKLSLVA
jgi:hypothetical protein